MGNRFAGSFKLNPGQPGDIIWVNESRKIRLLENTVLDQGSYAGDLVKFSKSQDPREAQNNNASGIAAKP